jgi:hypothetical protein
MRGRRIMSRAVLTLMLGSVGLSACGGDDGARQEKVCKSCQSDVGRQCFNECRELCRPDDPNCETRCAGQCDECRRDLVCSECRGDCTGTLSRCAPTNETVQCRDGTFGGEPPVVP